MSYRAHESSNTSKGGVVAKRNNDEQRARKVRQKRIGEQLRKIYDDVTSEPVPDDFLNLLEQADKASKKQ